MSQYFGKWTREKKVSLLNYGTFRVWLLFAVISNNKLLNFVLFHKGSFSPIIPKFSVKPYNKILEKLRCRGSVSYTTQCNGKMSEFQNSKPGLMFSRTPSYISFF